MGDNGARLLKALTEGNTKEEDQELPKSSRFRNKPHSNQQQQHRRQTPVPTTEVASKDEMQHPGADNSFKRFYQRIISVPKEVTAYTQIELAQLVSQQPEVILQELIKEGKFYKFFENDYISNETLENILRLLDFACQCHVTHFEDLLCLLSRVLTHEKFVMYHLRRFLDKCCQDIKKYHKVLNNFGTFLLYSTKFHPFSTVLALRRLEKVFENILGKLDQLEEETSKLFEAVNEHLSKFLTDKPMGEIEKLSRLELFHCIEPDADFHTVEPLPTMANLLEEPFVRPNLIKGHYFSIKHYLDVQFRLFREDMLRNLRQGIQAFQKYQNRPDKLNNLDGVNVYLNCKVDDVLIKYDFQIQYIAKFDAKNLMVDWESSSRFTFGSLVALSLDNFKESIIYGVVDERNPVSLRKGKVTLQLKNISESLHKEVLLSSNITMIETSVFLLAYLPPLQVLKGITNAMPFSDYIVFADKNVKPPRYLHEDTCYDLRPLCMPFPKQYQNNQSDEEIMLDIILNKQMPIHEYDFPAIHDPYKSVNVLQEKAWPQAKALKFDKYQLEAFKAGITKEFALIQGPPGTGKTFIGLRIVQVLLHNRNFWGPSPILVVCFKNHALDQFLEGVLSLTTKVIRIGSNSKSQVLAPYILQNIVQHCQPQIGQLNSKIAQIDEECTEKKNMLSSSKKSLVPFSHLKEFIIDKHLKCFKDFNENNICSGDEDDLLAYWLCTGDGAHCDLNQSSIEAVKNRMRASKEHNSLVNKRHQPFKKEEELVEIDMVHEMREYAESQHRYRAARNTPGSEDSCSDNEEQEESLVSFMLRTSQPFPFNRAADIENIWALDYETRWKLYHLWVSQLKTSKKLELDGLEKERDKVLKEISTYNKIEKKNICERADIIGITTSGAALKHDLLLELKPKIILIEEAAEILEAHTVSCLTEQTLHVVLIGDHQQLQPTTTVHDLTINYDLHISLFERVINNGIKSCCLVSQHRMRPAIAHLLEPHIYEKLSNDRSVRQYEDILGMGSNIFFLNHEETDMKRNGTTSFYNSFEARFLVELSRYLLFQGYKTSQITILATYTGQVFEIKELIEKNKLLNDLRVTTVDNFQGEENDIILISFVRSNAADAIGFLKVSNRVCVALSRARKGLYCVGNFSLMASKSELWKNIYMELCNQGAINNLKDQDSGLQLKCQNHPDFPITVRRPEDFKKTNLGGCQKNCGFRFECGHECPLTCHIYDKEHKENRCKRPCEKEVCKDHPCGKECSRPCGDCEELVYKTLPLCGHQAKMACSRDPSTFVCSLKCIKKLPCGDSCQSHCSQVCQPCKKECPVQAKCKHLVKVPCCLSKAEAMVHCKEKCPGKLECGHFCCGTCGECWQGRLHKLCMEKCNKILLCGHPCKSLCHEICPPCPEECRDICAHSRCPRKCGSRCIPCNKTCTWKCIHYKCTKKCNEYCDRVACNEICPKLIEECGHRCTGFCGEPCPECPQCNDAGLTSTIRGNDRYIMLEECGDRLSFKHLASHFSFDKEMEAIQVKECPLCQIPVYKNKRFKTQILKTMDNIFLIIEKVFGTLKERRQKTFIIIDQIESVKAIAILKWFPATTEILNNLIDKTQKTRSLQDLNMTLNILHILEFVGKFTEYLDSLDVKEFPFKSSDLEYLEAFMEMLKAFSEAMGHSQMLDIQQEAKRLTALFLVLQWRTGLKCPEYGVDRVLTEVHNHFLEPCPFSKTFEVKIFTLFKEALRKQGVEGAPISPSLKLMPIMRAIRNHWFICKNGHFLWKLNAKSPISSCLLCKT